MLEEGKHIIVLRLSAAPLAGHAAHSERHASMAWAGGGITPAKVRAFEILYVKK